MRALLVSAVLLVMNVACSSGGDGGGGGAGGAAGSSGSGAVGGFGAFGGQGGSAGTAGSGGSGGSAGTAGGTSYVSNTPGAAVVLDRQGDAADLSFLSTAIFSSPSGSEYYQEWLAVVRNDGASVICLISGEATYQDGGGAEVAKHFTFVDGPPHRLSSSTLSTPCLGPGQVGGMYSNAFAPAPLDTSAIATVTLSLSGSAEPAVPHEKAPTLTGITSIEKFGKWAVTGTLTGTATIYNIGMDFYAVDATGLVLGRAQDVYLDTLFAGQTYQIDSSTYSAEVATEIHGFTDFIEGAAMMLPPPEGSAADSVDLQAKSITLSRYQQARRAYKERQRHNRERFQVKR